MGATRRGRALLLGVLVALAGCSGTPAISTDVDVSEREDLDCDGAISAFEVSAMVEFGQSPDNDISVALQYQGTEGDYNDIQRVEEVAGQQVAFNEQINSGSLSVEGETQIRVIVIRNGVISNEQIAASTTEPFQIESPEEDETMADAHFQYEPTPVQMNETAIFSATDTGEKGCAISAYRWDFDGDGDTEARGREVMVEFDRDGRRDVTLTVETTANVTQSTTREVLVMHDPDGDGITTSREREINTDPYDSDTDNDLFPDGHDPMPTSFLFPTGVLHIILAGLLYIGFMLYRGSASDDRS